MRKRFLVECPVCGAKAESYDKFLEHVSSKHPDKLWARFRGRVVEG